MGCGCNKKKQENIGESKPKVEEYVFEYKPKVQENLVENKPKVQEHFLTKTKEFFNNICNNKMVMTLSLLILLIIVLYSILSSNKKEYIIAPKGYIPPSEYNYPEIDYRLK